MSDVQPTPADSSLSCTASSVCHGHIAAEDTVVNTKLALPLIVDTVRKKMKNGVPGVSLKQPYNNTRTLKELYHWLL